MTEQLVGVLPIHKERGMTSHDVVARARRILQERRIGHTGTLDPEVTGVLPLCIGQATRIVEYLQELPKEYEAELVLGLSTDTEDLTGERLESVEEVTLSEDDIRQAVASFLGEIEQIPPMYSAVRVNGKRLYELAREGKTVERKARKVMIHEIEILRVELNERYPRITFRVLCSKGTYIRTLCSDIGSKLGLPAVMGKLVRTQTGPFQLRNCVTLAELEQLKMENRLHDAFITMDKALDHMRVITIDSALANRAWNGQKIRLDDHHLEMCVNGQLVRLHEEGTERLIGIFRMELVVAGERIELSPVKVFH